MFFFNPLKTNVIGCRVILQKQNKIKLLIKSMPLEHQRFQKRGGNPLHCCFAFSRLCLPVGQTQSNTQSVFSLSILSRPATELSKKCFWNQTFDKGRLKNFVLWFFLKYGEYKTVRLVEELKTVGFQYATKAGISLGVEDLKIPPKKAALIYEAENLSISTIRQFKRGEITEVERFQLLIDTWHRTSEQLKIEVIENFEGTDVLNPVYMMAFSGARGNISQVRQLVGMRGLMSNPQGQIIDFPIRSNFREGLTLTEYIISSYGARKGIVDTALRTANAGYLTRRLVDVAQHVIISSTDCGTNRGIFLTDMKEGNKTIYSLQNRLIGRVLARDIYNNQQIKIASKNIEISNDLATIIAQNHKKVFVRSPLTCQTNKLVCQLCYGWSLAQGNLVSIGEAVGIVAAQSIGEPGTQLTMRTFHTGGVFAGNVSDQIKAPFDGFVVYKNPIAGKLIRTPEGKVAFLTKDEGSFSVHKLSKTNVVSLSKEDKLGINGQISSININNVPEGPFLPGGENEAFIKAQEKKSFKIPFYTLLFLRNREKVFHKQVIAQISSINRQKTATDQAELTIKAEISGLFYSKNLEIEETKVGPLLKDNMVEPTTMAEENKYYPSEASQNDYLHDAMVIPDSILDTINRAWSWGYAWILSGRIYQLPLLSSFFPYFGDYVTKKSFMNCINWYIPSTFGSGLRINRPLKFSLFNKNSIKTMRQAVSSKEEFILSPRSENLVGLTLNQQTCGEALNKSNSNLIEKDFKLVKFDLISFELAKLTYKNIGYFLKLSQPSTSFAGYVNNGLVLGSNLYPSFVKNLQYHTKGKCVYSNAYSSIKTDVISKLKIIPQNENILTFAITIVSKNSQTQRSVIHLSVQKNKMLQNSILSLGDTLFLFSSIFPKNRFFSQVKAEDSLKLNNKNAVINPTNWEPSFNVFLNWFPKRFFTKTAGLIFMEPIFVNGVRPFYKNTPEGGPFYKNPGPLEKNKPLAKQQKINKIKILSLIDTQSESIKLKRFVNLEKKLLENIKKLSFPTFLKKDFLNQNKIPNGSVKKGTKFMKKNNLSSSYITSVSLSTKSFGKDNFKKNLPEVPFFLKEGKNLAQTLVYEQYQKNLLSCTNKQYLKGSTYFSLFVEPSKRIEKFNKPSFKFNWRLTKNSNSCICPAGKCVLAKDLNKKLISSQRVFWVPQPFYKVQNKNNSIFLNSPAGKYKHTYYRPFISPYKQTLVSINKLLNTPIKQVNLNFGTLDIELIKINRQGKIQSFYLNKTRSDVASFTLCPKNINNNKSAKQLCLLKKTASLVPFFYPFLNGGTSKKYNQSGNRLIKSNYGNNIRDVQRTSIVTIQKAIFRKEGFYNFQTAHFIKGHVSHANLLKRKKILGPPGNCLLRMSYTDQRIISLKAFCKIASPPYFLNKKTQHFLDINLKYVQNKQVSSVYITSKKTKLEKPPILKEDKKNKKASFYVDLFNFYFYSLFNKKSQSNHLIKQKKYNEICSPHLKDQFSKHLPQFNYKLQIKKTPQMYQRANQFRKWFKNINIRKNYFQSVTVENMVLKKNKLLYKNLGENKQKINNSLELNQQSDLNIWLKNGWFYYTTDLSKFFLYNKKLIQVGKNIDSHFNFDRNNIYIEIIMPTVLPCALTLKNLTISHSNSLKSNFKNNWVNTNHKILLKPENWFTFLTNEIRDYPHKARAIQISLVRKIITNPTSENYRIQLNFTKTIPNKMCRFKIEKTHFLSGNLNFQSNEYVSQKASNVIVESRYFGKLAKSAEIEANIAWKNKKKPKYFILIRKASEFKIFNEIEFEKEIYALSNQKNEGSIISNLNKIQFNKQLFNSTLKSKNLSMFEEHKPKIAFSKENYFKITQKKYKDLKIKNIKKKFVIGLLRMNQFNIKFWPYSIFTFQCFFNIFQKIMLCVSSSNIDRIDRTEKPNVFFDKTNNLTRSLPKVHFLSGNLKMNIKNKKLQKTIWLNNKKTVNSLYATQVYRTKQFFWINKKIITMFMLKEDKQFKKTPHLKRSIFLKIESKKIKAKLLNKSYNSMSLYSQYKTGLLNKQKINPPVGAISKYQSSILKIISNQSFYLYLKQIGVDTRTLTNNELGLYELGLYRSFIQTFTKCISEENRHSIDKQNSFLKIKKCSIWGSSSLMLTCLKSINLAPFIISYKAPYSVNFPFKTPMCFFSEQYQPTFLFNNPWQIKQFWVKDKLQQNKNVINIRNNFIKTRREISRIIESNNFKKVISSYLFKINKVEMISKNNNGNFILNPHFKREGSLVPQKFGSLLKMAWKNKKRLSVSSGICIENVKNEPCSLNTNNTHQKSKSFEISKTFSNLSSSFFLPIIEYSLVNNLAKSIPVCLSPSGIDLALQREAFIAASINNLTKGFDVQNATNPTTETQSSTLSNSSIFLNHIDNKKFLFGRNGPMLASLATGSPTSNNSFLRFRQSNEELSLNNKASLYKTEFISYINNTVNSQFPFMKTYSYSSIEGEFIYQKKKLRGKKAKINFEPPVGAIYNELIGLKKRTSKSAIGKIIRQKFTDYFITKKTIDYSCMILTKKDQLSYSFSNLGLRVSNNLVNNEITQYNNYVALNLGIKVQNKAITETNKPKIFIKQSNQKYKEIYFTLEKLKKKNQYLINDIVINLLNLLISSTNYNFSPGEAEANPPFYKNTGTLAKTSETTSMLKEPEQNKKTECADELSKFEIHELFSGLVTLDTLDGRIQTINSDNGIDSEASNNNVEISNTTEIQTEVQNVPAIKLNKIPAGFAQQKSKLLIGEFLVYGDKIHPTLAISKGGQIIHINNKKITLRKGQPIFISPQAILHKYDGDFVDEQSSVITLAYQQLKTGDIVQGIPKIEQFFEARTTKRGRLFKDSLENLLKALFNRYNLKLSREQAVRQSFYKIQQIIIDGVQRVYRSQGVTIADKHLEVIVKQMTSKVRITFGGSTGYLPGEICDLYDIELLNKEIRPKILYEPIVLGITKASLEVKSFLSAASFQQTTRVLTKAALSRKNDYLNGLKENVILGNLIPAGTGYLVYLDQFSTRGFTTDYGKTKD